MRHLFPHRDVGIYSEGTVISEEFSVTFGVCVRQGHVEQWIDFSSNELDIPLTRWGGPLHGYGPRIKEVRAIRLTPCRQSLSYMR